MASGEIPIPKWLDERRWIALVAALFGTEAIVLALIYGDKPGTEPRREEIVVEDGRQFIRETGGDEYYGWVWPVVVPGVVVAALGLAIVSGRKPLPGSAEQRRQKVGQLSSSLKDALHIIEHIKSEIEEGERLVGRLERDAETKRLLAGLQSEQARAVLEEMRNTVRGETNRGTWFQFLMGLGFFGAGVVVTLILT